MYTNTKFTGRVNVADAMEYHSCEFSGVDFSGVSISKCYFSECKFTNADFTGANLTSSMFVSCKFNAPNFTKAKLACKFKSCEIVDANCSDTDMTEARFDGGSFGHAVLKKRSEKLSSDRRSATQSSDRRSAKQSANTICDTTPHNKPPKKRRVKKVAAVDPASLVDTDSESEEAPILVKRGNVVACRTCGRRMKKHTYIEHVKIHKQMQISCAETMDGCPFCSFVGYNITDLHAHMEKCVLAGGKK